MIGRAAVVLALTLLAPALARASFHIADISEVMTRYGGNTNVEFVEIEMLAVGQQFVDLTKLNVYDSSGNFVATVLTINGNVAGGSGRPWIMGTTALETAVGGGFQVDFEFPGGSLPDAGGMVCWGNAGSFTGTPNCPASGSPYVDCVAYGNYSGPTNNCIGNDTPLTADGHSLTRISPGHDNLTDFACGDPATPENNVPVAGSLPATTPCPFCGDDIVTPPEECDGLSDTACPGECLPNCACPICGDNSVNSGLEECDGTDDAACPGDCLLDCTCATCGDNVTEPPAEECDGTDDGNCPGACVAPGPADECQCPGELDHFLCYKAAAKAAQSVTLADAFDNGTFAVSGIKRLCAPANKNGEGVSDNVTHLTVYKIKGPHAKQSGVNVVNQFGTFSIDTKKADRLMVPASKSLAPNPPPAPLSSTFVDHYRCLKAKYASGSFQVPKGTMLTVEDQFGLRNGNVEIKKPSVLCLATSKNSEAVNRPNDHLLCFTVKIKGKIKAAGIQTNDQFGALTFDHKGESEVCVPSTL
jgi:hypothetical protein